MDNRFSILLMAVLAAACTSSNTGHALMTTGGAPSIELSLSERCDNIDGWFNNSGTALHPRNVVKSPRLAHAVFRLALPSKNGYPQLPESVRLSVDPARMVLLVTVIGDGASRDWSTGYECRNGWLHIRDYQGEQYLGDGVTQEWSRADVLLATDADGNLVAHVVGEAGDRIFLGGTVRSGGEDWYLFQRKP